MNNFTREVMLTTAYQSTRDKAKAEMSNLIAMELASHPEFTLETLASIPSGSYSSNSARVRCLNGELELRFYSTNSYSAEMTIYPHYTLNNTNANVFTLNITLKELTQIIDGYNYYKYETTLQFVNIKNGFMLRTFNGNFRQVFAITNIEDLITGNKMKMLIEGFESSGSRKIYISDGLSNTGYNISNPSGYRYSEGLKQILTNPLIYHGDTQNIVYILKNLYSGALINTGFIKLDDKYYFGGASNLVLEVEEY